MDLLSIALAGCTRLDIDTRRTHDDFDDHIVTLRFRDWTLLDLEPGLIRVRRWLQHDTLRVRHCSR